MNRPLPTSIWTMPTRIYSLYDHFSRVGYLCLVTAEQSMRYVSLHRHSPRHREDVDALHPASSARNPGTTPNLRADRDVPKMQPHSLTVWVLALRCWQKLLRLPRGRHKTAVFWADVTAAAAAEDNDDDPRRGAKHGAWSRSHRSVIDNLLY